MNFSKTYFTTFTVTVASPAVFTCANHQLYSDDIIRLETTGALPTGLAVKTDYYIVYNGITANTFQLSTSMGGDPINTSGTQSGTHTFLKTSKARLTPSFDSNK